MWFTIPKNTKNMKIEKKTNHSENWKKNIKNKGVARTSPVLLIIYR